MVEESGEREEQPCPGAASMQAGGRWFSLKYHLNVEMFYDISIFQLNISKLLYHISSRNIEVTFITKFQQFVCTF